MTNVTKDPSGLDLAADYTGTGGAPVERGTASTGTWVPTSLRGVGTLVLVTGTGGGPMVGATTGDWLLVGLLVAWIIWVVYENHNGKWRSGKKKQR